MLKRLLNHVTNRIHALPVLVLMPHSRCNCRCVMCDIWKANHEKRELTVEELDPHLISFARLGVKRVALSGGEALLHSNLWMLCEKLRSIGIKVSLLSTGVTVRQHAAAIISNCDDLIVSLDGTKDIHNSIRNLPAAFDKLEEGVKEIKRCKPSFRVTARTVVQKQNFRALPQIIQAAKGLGLDQISFLAADVSSEAFNRPGGWPSVRASIVALDFSEMDELDEILQSVIHQSADFDSGFIAESPEKILDIGQHYRAIAGATSFPKRKCNAPWVSAVIESNGDVMPCFFHKPYGNIRDQNFVEILNSEKSIAFRRNLKVDRDPICQRCVCSLHLPLAASS
jgi:MoaA/NifB/PqqE/SkfB family radical SAM enzyme